MEKSPQQSRPVSKDGRSFIQRGGPNLWLALGLVVVVVIMFVAKLGPRRSLIPYHFFIEQIKNKNIALVEIGDQEALGTFRTPPEMPTQAEGQGKEGQGKNASGSARPLHKNFRVVLLRGTESQEQLRSLLERSGVPYQAQPSSDTALFTVWLLAILLPVALFIFFWVMFRRTRDQIMGGGFLSGFSKSPAKRYEGSQQAITFNDVAGLQGVKEDLNEIVDYLKDPQKFQRLGGRVPKGVLLNGAPGTGKTLLARAVAGEAGVPFYSVSGSEFIQMFVGVGASRVRDLFQTAKENSPAIIFIDEIDAVGRQRGAGLGGGHDEREQTLNQILNEMDGFTQNDSVIVLAATNRPDVLDPALLRPGRFDRHVTVSRPSQRGRLEIFKVHVRDVPLADDVDLDLLASATIGLTGADIRNIVNEAALWAARQDKSRVEMADFDYARDKVLMGAKREEVLSQEEKRKTAYHEAGHTVLAWLLPGAHRVHKVTIVPRGRTLGVTQILPSEDRQSLAEVELKDFLTVLLAGRAAERMVYDQSTIGAENDLERATGIARRMVTHWGMSARLGPVSYKLADDDPFLGREIHQQRQFSEHTMEVIDEEVAKILHAASQRSSELLKEHRPKLELLVTALLDQEELDEKEISALIGPPTRNRPGASDEAADPRTAREPAGTHSAMNAAPAERPV